MREYGGQREAHTARDHSEQAFQAEDSEHEQHANAIQLSTTGPIPPVLPGFKDRVPSASELAFGATTLASTQSASVSASPVQKHADDVARIESIYETAQGAAISMLGSLCPGYLAARDQRDVAAVAELGGRMIAGFSVVHGAKAALDQMLRTVPHHSIRGASVDDNLALASMQQSVEAKIPRLAALIQTVDAAIATTLTPHVFQGQEVAGQMVAISLDGPSVQNIPKLTGELQRTLGMLVLVDELKAQLLEGKKGLDKASLEATRGKLVPWASRPLDLAFLRAALGPIWELLEATATGPLVTKPSAVLADATKQAKHTGWLGDIGRVDIDSMCMELRIGGRQSAEFAIGQLYTADPDTRARLLIQIKERGLLDALCSAVGWADIKQLHDSLGSGFGEIKTDLQRYFLGKGKYGPSLGSEWENHDRSLHSLVGQLGGVGKILNFALDVGTFGFNSSYGKALDDRSQGITSEAEASRAKLNAAGKTAAIAAISILTGGLADKVVRGGAGTVSALRGAVGGAAGGSVGAISGLGASDAYGNYVSGDRQGFSSPEEYVKAALLGGAIGGVVGGLTQGISNRVADQYLPRASELSPPSEAASLAKENFEYGVDSGGRRNDVPLTPVQIEEALTYARVLGVPEDAIHLVDESNTSWGRIFGEERLHVGTDVAPSTSPRWRASSANSRISVKGAVAHEVVGHRAADIAGRTQAELVLEEAQASIRAARFAPQLTAIERLTLIRDAVERLQRAGYRVSQVRETLWIDTP